MIKTVQTISSSNYVLTFLMIVPDIDPAPVNAHRDSHTPGKIDREKRAVATFTQNSLGH